VLDVIAMKNDKMRGQAFIVFKDLQTSTAALRKEDGRFFAGKQLRIAYARGKSYATIEKESGKEALYQYRMGIAKNPEGGSTSRLTVSGAGKELDRAQNKRDREDGDGDEEEEAKKAKTNGQANNEEDDSMEVESDEDDGDEEAPGPAPAA
jgi:RNA recognition motif-containing protein